MRELVTEMQFNMYVSETSDYLTKDGKSIGQSVRINILLEKTLVPKKRLNGKEPGGEAEWVYFGASTQPIFGLRKDLYWRNMHRLQNQQSNKFV